VLGWAEVHIHAIGPNTAESSCPDLTPPGPVARK